MTLEGYNFDCVEGDWIRLMEIIDEIGNRIMDTTNSFSDFFTSGSPLTFNIGTLTDDANPSVGTGETVWLTGGTSTITDIDDGSTGRFIIILAEHSLTIDHGVHLWLSGNVNYDMVAGDSLMLVQKVDTFWYELARSGEFNVTTLNATGNITTDANISGNNLSATLNVSGATGTFSGAVGVGSLDAGSGAIGTTGTVSGTNVTASAVLGGTTLSVSSAATVGSLDAGSGLITTTGNIQGNNVSATLAVGGGSLNITNAASVGSLDAGSGTIETLGAVNGASGTITGALGVGSLDAGAGTIETTGALKGGTTTIGALTATSVDAGSGTIQTTGNLIGTLGAITPTSVDTGAGTIETTGALKGGTTTLGAVTASSLDAGSGTIETTGALKGGTTTIGALTATSVDAGSGTIQTTGSLLGGATTVGTLGCSSVNAGSGTITTTGANNGATGTYTGKVTVGSFGDNSPATLDTSATPSVAGGMCFTVTASANDITNFDDGFDGQLIFLRATGTRNIDETANIVCSPVSTGITLNNGDGAIFMRISSVWYLLSQSDN